MDKLKKNKCLLILLIISLIAFLFGCIFITILNSSDQELVKEYISNFLNDIYENKLNYIETLKSSVASNIFLIVVIWLLGLSVIGIPIILFIYFFKAFTLGFSISAFILTYKTKGIIFSILYIFPNELLKYFSYTILIINAINISKKLITSILKKETICFNKLINKYLKILSVTLFIIILTSLYEVYGIPFIFNKLYFLIK